MQYFLSIAWDLNSNKSGVNSNKSGVSNEPDRNDGIPNSNHNINNRKKYNCEKYGFSNLTQLKI